jgi:hypothetical protein
MRESGDEKKRQGVSQETHGRDCSTLGYQRRLPWLEQTLGCQSGDPQTVAGDLVQRPQQLWSDHTIGRSSQQHSDDCVGC